MADRVIFALYPAALEGWVARYGGLLRPGCICTDVSGVKAGLVETVQTALPEGVEFIASHPWRARRSAVWRIPTWWTSPSPIS